MKRNIVFAVICAALLFPVAARAEMTKQEAAEFLQKVVKARIKEAGKEALEDNLNKLSPKGMKAFKKVTGVIENCELAASICWDLIQLGLQTNRAKFAKEFAMRLRKYVPSEYYETAELFGGMTEKLLGWRLTNQADCTRSCMSWANTPMMPSRKCPTATSRRPFRPDRASKISVPL